MEKISYFGAKLIYFFAAFFLIITGSWCLFCRSNVSLNWDEHTTFTTNGIVFLFFMLAVGLMLWFARSLLRRIDSRLLFCVLLLVEMACGLYFIFAADSGLRADPDEVYKVALQLNHGNYSSFFPGKYIAIYPHQLGLATFERFVLAIAPDTRLLFLLNLVFVGGIQLCGYTMIFYAKKANSLSGKYILLASFFFLPQFFFILFAYGQIPGLFFLMLSLVFWQRFFQKNSLVCGLLGTVLLTISCILRNNYQIAALALAVLLLFSALKNKKWQGILFAVLVVGAAFSADGLIRSAYEQKSGIELDHAIPKIAFVAMGMQDDPRSKRLGGWYNWYTVDLLRDNHDDPVKTSKQAEGYIRDRLEAFRHHPKYAWKFYKEKYLSTWGEPTFQSIWSGPVGRMGQQKNAPALDAIYDGGGIYQVLVNLMNAGNVFIYLFAGIGAAFLLFDRQKKWLPLILFSYIYYLGGVAFHLLWETKSQYVYPYVYCLIPAAVFGAGMVKKFIADKQERRPI
ncbi:MAG: hypothetical protein LKJ03_04390 [Enterococcaceae bacterium]|nr:hypothetical protein [Enterococcaceae bacterium]MCI1918810.1 hypothetical protein [Enterococcaceae bacterium]